MSLQSDLDRAKEEKEAWVMRASIQRALIELGTVQNEPDPFWMKNTLRTIELILREAIS